MKLKQYSFSLMLFTQILISQELDSSLTLGKKSLMILPTTEEVYYDISNKMLSIIADQATELGRFEVIDRNIVDEILLEQKFQLSGMVSDNQIVEIGELAAAEEALILTIINFGQKGTLIHLRTSKLWFSLVRSFILHHISHLAKMFTLASKSLLKCF